LQKNSEFFYRKKLKTTTIELVSILFIYLFIYFREEKVGIIKTRVMVMYIFVFGSVKFIHPIGGWWMIFLIAYGSVFGDFIGD
jgi:hypothetical protein